MTDDIYAPPLADIGTGVAESDKYYVVSTGKFLVLSLLTMNMYLLYWFYRNWKLYRAKTGEPMWPVARAIFAIFFTHALFRNVDNDLGEAGQPDTWHPSSLATTYVLLAILDAVLSRLSWYVIGSPATDIAGLALVPFITYVIFKAQVVINGACGDPQGERNAAYTWANWIWICVGILIWGLAMIGLYIIIFPGAGL